MKKPIAAAVPKPDSVEPCCCCQPLPLSMKILLLRLQEEMNRGLLLRCPSGNFIPLDPFWRPRDISKQLLMAELRIKLAALQGPVPPPSRKYEG